MDTETLQTVKLAEVPAEPWRNGGGTTQELLAWPQRSAWRLRLSVARIERGGPFSAYPGVSRDFAVLSGAGVRLSWGERATVLTTESEVFSFDGGEPPQCELLDGPTTDLNLMTQQGAGQGRLWRAQAGVPWASPARLRGVFAANPCTLHRPGNPPLALSPGTLAWTDGAWPRPWALTGVTEPPQAWWLAFEARPGASA